MRLNDGDTIEWGLSSWRLLLHDEVRVHNRPAAVVSRPALPSDAVAEYLDLDWFKQQRINPQAQQDPFDIIPVRETAMPGGTTEAGNTLVQLHQEYQLALSGQETYRKQAPSPLYDDTVKQDLASLRDQKTENSTLQDMVTGTLNIDDILNTLDATDNGETAWPAEEPLPDILLLLSPEQHFRNIHRCTLPDLTQREHRIIGIDSHYRVNPEQKNGDISHE